MDGYQIGFMVGVFVSLLYQGFVLSKLRQRVWELENKVRIELYTLRIIANSKKGRE